MMTSIPSPIVTLTQLQEAESYAKKSHLPSAYRIVTHGPSPFEIPTAARWIPSMVKALVGAAGVLGIARRVEIRRSRSSVEVVRVAGRRLQTQPTTGVWAEPVWRNGPLPIFTTRTDAALAIVSAIAVPAMSLELHSGTAKLQDSLCMPTSVRLPCRCR